MSEQTKTIRGAIRTTVGAASDAVCVAADTFSGVVNWVRTADCSTVMDTVTLAGVATESFMVQEWIEGDLDHSLTQEQKAYINSLLLSGMTSLEVIKMFNASQPKVASFNSFFKKEVKVIPTKKTKKITKK